MPTRFKPFNDRFEISRRKILTKYHLHRLANEVTCDGIGALQFAFVLQFQFSSYRRQSGIDICNARDDHVLTRDEGAAFGVAEDVFQTRNGQALADARSFVDSLVGSCLESNRFYNLFNEMRHKNLPFRISANPGFLFSDRKAMLERPGIMRLDFRSDPVLQRGDDLAAGRVVLRIGGEHQDDVERQPDRVSLNLNVAFLHDIKQAHLDLACKIRQFVNGENSTIGARKQPIVHAQFAADGVSSLCSFDGIDIADDIGDGNVGRGELFDIAVLFRPVIDPSVVSHFFHQIPAPPADRTERIVVDLAPFDHRYNIVEKFDQSAKNAAFCLATQAQQDHVMTREDRVDNLRNNGLFISDNAGKYRSLCFELPNKIDPHLILDRSLPI